MGINLTWVCDTHKLQHTSMRGEESIDFQDLVRIHPDCFKDGKMTVYHDGFWYNNEYQEFYPRWDQRPAERPKKPYEPIN